ncbi:MAG: hypothetical protein RM021_006245, partial [Nostoc sp. EkiNYC01]|nr:hypothetical protein [Nostoc sp. EkiNYC01]
EPFPNSEVKRCCGNDSLGVALRQNSSMPGLYIQLNPLALNTAWGFLFYWLERKFRLLAVETCKLNCYL